jgi:uncharacterized protein (DUF433 family)
MNYRERITVEPGKRGGKPCIRGLRITVYDVLDQLSAGMTPEEIIEDFSELELEDMRLPGLCGRSRTAYCGASVRASLTFPSGLSRRLGCR